MNPDIFVYNPPDNNYYYFCTVQLYYCQFRRTGRCCERACRDYLAKDYRGMNLRRCSDANSAQDCDAALHRQSSAPS